MDPAQGISAHDYLNELKDRLAPGMTEAVALDTCLAVAAELASAHQKDKLHLGVHPASILIPKLSDGTPDFIQAHLVGVGALLSAGGSGEGLASQNLPPQGAPGFMPPEQYSGAQDMHGVQDVPAMGKASDVFSLGATLYALLCGQPPFTGMTADKVMEATVSEPAGKMRTWRPDVSRATARLIEICLEKNPSNRFANAAVLLESLQVARQCMEGDVGTQEAALDELETLLKPVAVKEQLPPPVAVKNGTSLFDDLLKKKPDGHEIHEGIEGQASHDAPLKAVEFPPQIAPSPESISEVAVVTAPVVEEASVPEPVQMSAPAAAEEWVDPALQAAADVEPSGRADGDTAPSRKNAASLLLAAIFVVICGATLWYLSDRTPIIPVVQKTEDSLSDDLKSEPPPLPVPSLKVAPKPPVLEVETPPAAPRSKAPILEDTEFVTPAKYELPAANVQAPKDISQQAESAQKELEALEVKRLLAQKMAEQKRLEEEQLLLKKQALEKELQRGREAREEESRRLAEKKIAEKLEETQRAAESAQKADAERKALESQKLAAAVAEEEKKAHVARMAEEDRLKVAQAAAAEAARKLAEAEVVKKAETERKILEAQKLAEAQRIASAEAAAVVAVAEEEEEKNAEAKRLSENVRIKDTAKEVSLNLGGGEKMTFVRVSGGVFTMGTVHADLVALCQAESADAKDYQDESPTHEMTLKDYYIEKTPVTVAQFRRFVKDSGYVSSAERAGAAYVLKDRKWLRVDNACWKNPGFEQKDDHPVVMLSYRDGEAFAAWVSKVSARPARIPTEAEWEYAARGPQNNLWPWGNKWNGKLANHSDKRLKPYCMEDWNYSKADDGYAFTSPVGTYKNQSWCGALDMAGNVFQWCADAYELYPQNASAPKLEVEEDKDAKRVLRGGSFLFRPMDCRTAARRSLKPRSWSCELGLRLAFSPNGEK